MLAPWVIQHFPPHRVYTEVYGGAASILLRKDRSYAEIYNDLDDEVVTLFQVLRDTDLSAQLIERIMLTPFSRREFNGAYDVTDDPVEKIRRLIVRSFMGFGSNGHNPKWKTGFRANSNRSGSTPAHDWQNYPASLKAVIDRLAKVVVENRLAVDVLKQHDGVDTLHYVDPPYVVSTREPNRAEIRGSYKFELTDEDHADLADALHSLTGMVVLSGYPSKLYDNELFPRWHRVTRDAFADGARQRTEVLWLNDAAINATGHGPLFERDSA
jgi:DNA adenine methylase